VRWRLLNLRVKWCNALVEATRPAAFDFDLLSSIEDASLNASAPPQQRWIDGWLVRYNAGKARRSRSINAVAAGRFALAHKLKLAAELFDAAGLPLVFRITPFSQPADLDAQLAALGFVAVDPTDVMVCTSLPPAGMPWAVAGTAWESLNGAAYAKAVGALRGSTPAECEAHAQRLAESPVPYQGFAVRRSSDGHLLACGQMAQESDLVGLYDVFTDPQARSQGLAYQLCERMLSLAGNQGARTGYLQVQGDNYSAQRVYQRLGFARAYGYHYRQPV
jgi:ribosomal protein S18 acetylase RimI-like enzyme